MVWCSNKSHNLYCQKLDILAGDKNDVSCHVAWYLYDCSKWLAHLLITTPTQLLWKTFSNNYYIKTIWSIYPPMSTAYSWVNWGKTGMKSANAQKGSKGLKPSLVSGWNDFIWRKCVIRVTTEMCFNKFFTIIWLLYPTFSTFMNANKIFRVKYSH